MSSSDEREQDEHSADCRCKQCQEKIGRAMHDLLIAWRGHRIRERRKAGVPEQLVQDLVDEVSYGHPPEDEEDD